MYTPKSFRQDDPEQLFALMEQYSFATLVHSSSEGPRVTHLPLLLDRTGELGTVIGHLARANDHWQESGDEAVIIYQGPHGYISPSWYEADNVVPTWNYAAVHARGPIEWIHDEDELLEIVTRYVDHFESTFASPWRMSNNDPSFNRQLLSAIVGFRIQITSLEGKWKLSQNHTAERRQLAIRQLSNQPTENSRELAAWMRRTLD